MRGSATSSPGSTTRCQVTTPLTGSLLARKRTPRSPAISTCCCHKQGRHDALAHDLRQHPRFIEAKPDSRCRAGAPHGQFEHRSVPRSPQNLRPPGIELRFRAQQPLLRGDCEAVLAGRAPGQDAPAGACRLFASGGVSLPHRPRSLMVSPTFRSTKSLACCPSVTHCQFQHLRRYASSTISWPSTSPTASAGSCGPRRARRPLSSPIRRATSARPGAPSRPRHRAPDPCPLRRAARGPPTGAPRGGGLPVMLRLREDLLEPRPLLPLRRGARGPHGSEDRCAGRIGEGGLLRRRDPLLQIDGKLQHHLQREPAPPGCRPRQPRFGHRAEPTRRPWDPLPSTHRRVPSIDPRPRRPIGPAAGPLPRPVPANRPADGRRRRATTPVAHGLQHGGRGPQSGYLALGCAQVVRRQRAANGELEHRHATVHQSAHRGVPAAETQVAQVERPSGCTATKV